jgi:hypothetical protein
MGAPVQHPEAAFLRPGAPGRVRPAFCVAVRYTPAIPQQQADDTIAMPAVVPPTGTSIPSDRRIHSPGAPVFLSRGGVHPAAAVAGHLEHGEAAGDQVEGDDAGGHCHFGHSADSHFGHSADSHFGHSTGRCGPGRPAALNRSSASQPAIGSCTSALSSGPPIAFRWVIGISVSRSSCAASSRPGRL